MYSTHHGWSWFEFGAEWSCIECYPFSHWERQFRVRSIVGTEHMRFHGILVLANRRNVGVDDGAWVDALECELSRATRNVNKHLGRDLHFDHLAETHDSVATSFHIYLPEGKLHISVLHLPVSRSRPPYSYLLFLFAVHAFSSQLIQDFGFGLDLG